MSCSTMSSHTTFLVSLATLLLVGTSITDAKPPKKLLDGMLAQPGEFKYQVSIAQEGFHMCGGSLISANHVLTAAHCFVGKLDPPYTSGISILTGQVKRSVGGEEHFPKYVTVHPDYVVGNWNNSWHDDIAVVTLATPAYTNELQAPIALPTTNLLENANGILSGWGHLSAGPTGVDPDELRKRPVSIITLKECRDRLFNKALDTNICGFDGIGTGICNGDSGGPLVYNNEIVGIVSWAISCGDGYPDLYTRVYAYKDFIQNATKRV